jgi:hypothetical protein
MAISRADIVGTLGPVDDEVVAEVVAIDPSPDELVQAWTWLSADEALINEGRPLASGKVAQLIDLLSPPSDDDARSR